VLAGLAGAALWIAGCSSQAHDSASSGMPAPGKSGQPTASSDHAAPEAPSQAHAPAATATSRAQSPPDTSAYPWHNDPSIKPLTAVDRLEDRFAPPAGFVRVPLEPGSFGAWLRDLPLAAASTPVVAYDGRELHAASDERIAAVATLDTGKADLQQCADAVMRLHAEWSFSRGTPNVSYQAASGTALPFARWAHGERIVVHGKDVTWAPSARPSSDHATFRQYLDAVFSWANTVSLARQAKPVTLENLRPGDFFVIGGSPGHTVLVLDMARAENGSRAVLLGQSYMPAQSYQVIRPSAQQAWFTVDPASAGIQTPFWPDPFPWSSIRRLD